MDLGLQVGKGGHEGESLAKKMAALENLVSVWLYTWWEVAVSQNII